MQACGHELPSHMCVQARDCEAAAREALQTMASEQASATAAAVEAAVAAVSAQVRSLRDSMDAATAEAAAAKERVAALEVAAQ
eukprot:7080529-Prymnesium_polylepis.1